MNRKLYFSLIILSVAVLPAIATAAVLVNSPVSTNTNNNQGNPVYLAPAQGYSTAKELGYLGLTGGGASSTGQTLYLNGTPGSGNVTLMNVLEIVNSTSSSYHGAIMLYLNGTLPTGVSVYYSNSPMSYTGTFISGGNKLQTSTAIHLTSSHLYLSFILLGTISAGTGQLNLQVSYQ